MTTSISRGHGKQFRGAFLSRCTLSIGVLAGILSLQGCGSTSTPDGPTTINTHDASPLPSMSEVPMFDGHTGNAMSFEDVLSRAKAADVVLIGEMHGHPLGLHVAAELWDEVARDRDSATLSMEFFERDEQVALDDYLHGVTDEDAFREASGRTGGNYPYGHRRMIETAKQYERPVVAANAPRRYVRVARMEGFEPLLQLSGAQRRLFNLPEELTTGRYRDDFFEIMSGMHMGEEGVEPEPGMRVEDFFRSQNVWDETMATSVMTAVRRRGQPVVHVVGQFHVNHNGGLTERIRAMGPMLDVFVISMVEDTADSLDVEHEGLADCVVHVGPHPHAGMMP